MSGAEPVTGRRGAKPKPLALALTGVGSQTPLFKRAAEGGMRKGLSLEGAETSRGSGRAGA